MKKIFSLIILLSVISLSCEKEKENEEIGQFDRELMLKNYAENLIIPSFNNLSSSINNMINSINEFEINQTEENLEKIQNDWVKAYEDWMYANTFNLGSAAEQGLNKSLFEEISTFPVSEIKINDAINSGQFNFNDFNRDARGFLTLEYLIFGGQEITNADILNLFQNQNNRISYLKNCALNIESRVNVVKNSWNGSYKAEFINNKGTDVGSSTSLLYNEFIKSFEVNKNFKIELPLGKRPGQTQVEPQLVEAYYSGKSIDFLKTHLTSIENIYYGKSRNGSNGLGFKDYLETVTGGPTLVESTLNQWQNVQTALNNLPANQSLSNLVQTNPQPVENLQVELQKHTRFFKSDMSSLLGIAITYSSGDGD